MIKFKFFNKFICNLLKGATVCAVSTGFAFASFFADFPGPNFAFICAIIAAIPLFFGGGRSVLTFYLKF